jgi:hypothetical protein
VLQNYRRVRSLSTSGRFPFARRFRNLVIPAGWRCAEAFPRVIAANTGPGERCADFAYGW